MIKIGIFGTIVIAALLAWFVIIPNFMQGTAVWCEYMDTKDKADVTTETKNFKKKKGKSPSRRYRWRRPRRSARRSWPGSRRRRKTSLRRQLR